MKSNHWVRLALILGSVFFLAAYIVRPVGVSTQFSVLSGMIHSTIDPNVIIEDDTRETGYRSSNAYYDKNDGKLARSIKHPWNYEFVFVLAIPLGAYLTNLITKKNKGERLESEETACESYRSGHKLNRWKKYLPYFVGGFLLLYGARMADGCTSGHMMSGMMQGSVSGYLFAGSVFAVAIPTAILVGLRRKRKGGR